ncbi:hypothetical protein CAOG_01064 [Capsaspora owczarzaki ATCC 30864]|uniref:hypothetical protein n=1 Tax=Capsaspora owczarzaki (strain ATCC 30864) TaxID=595528 RepID=UPI0001FE5887|nr:hypothetical protein CAOG_01064 [Capsaspora owczarzaki ATCC 30864]|eukprot:XP_004365935.1 hypothetical protein CAOG_01064 [Capsaspora owczarzaki ATCC 30864]
MSKHATQSKARGGGEKLASRVVSAAGHSSSARAGPAAVHSSHSSARSQAPRLRLDDSDTYDDEEFDDHYEDADDYDGRAADEFDDANAFNAKLDDTSAMMAAVALASTQDAAAMLTELGENVCAICLEDMFDESKAQLPPCLHEFCIRCVLTWSTVRSCCPLCKTEFSHVSTHFGLDGAFNAQRMPNLACLLVKARWLGITQSEYCLRVSADDASTAELPAEDEYDFDDEFDDSSFSQGKGKAGQRARVSQGMFNVYGRGFPPPQVPGTGSRRAKKKKNAAFSTNER